VKINTESRTSISNTLNVSCRRCAA